MKKKCAKCNRRTIPFFESYISKSIVCANCNTSLSLRYYNLIYWILNIFNFLLFIFLLGTFEKKQINLELTIPITIINVAIILYLTSYTVVSKVKDPPKAKNRPLLYIMCLLSAVYALSIEFMNKHQLQPLKDIFGIIIIIGLSYYFYSNRDNRND